MRILVLSDSHAGLRFMRSCIKAVKPGAVIHLGDYYDDAVALAEENPHIVFHHVPGNCDLYRCPMNTPQILCYPIGGVRFYMTHGHRHYVKNGTELLTASARSAGAQVVLYGHTHRADCRREADGLWIMNPGSCSSDGGSAGVIRIEENTVTACYIIRQTDLEEMK